MPDPFPPSRTRVFEPPEPDFQEKPKPEYSENEFEEKMHHLKTDQVRLEYMIREMDKIKQDPTLRTAAHDVLAAEKANDRYRNRLIVKYANPETPKGLMSWTPSTDSKLIYITPEESTEVGRLFQEQAGAHNKLEALIRSTLEAKGALYQIEEASERAGYGVIPGKVMDKLETSIKDTMLHEMEQEPIDPGPLKPTITPSRPVYRDPNATKVQTRSV